MDFGEFIDDIATKYGYSEELVCALKRCIPVMADGRDQDEIQLLKKMLEKVEIIIFDERPTKEQVDAIWDKKINGRNDHVNIENVDRGEYGRKKTSNAAFITSPVFDENMNIVDNIAFLYTTRLKEDDKECSMYGTRIDLARLIHEMEHAWATQKDAIIQKEDGNYVRRTGTAETDCEVNRETHTVIEKKEKYLYIEEAVNSLEEQEVLCKLLKIKKVNEIPGYKISAYQWGMTRLMKNLNDSLDLNLLRRWRLYNDKSVIKELNRLFRKTKHFENRKTEEYYNNKKKKIMEYKNLFPKLKEKVRTKLESLYNDNENLLLRREDESDFTEYFNSTLGKIFVLTIMSVGCIDIKNGDYHQEFKDVVKVLKKDATEPIEEMKKIHDLEQDFDDI